jgi:hypothetical protein
MSAFQQHLPMQILPQDHNPEGLKFQGFFESMEPNRMKLEIDSEFFSETRGSAIQVEFSMSNYNFTFASELLPEREGNCIYILKPKVIHKSQIRKAPRLKCFIKFNYTIWTEGGRYEAVITDLSTVGMKMTSPNMLHKNMILSLNVFIPGSSLRFICQGLVMWSNPAPNMNNVFLSGVKFTTLSIDAMKKVDKYINEEVEKNSKIL